MPWRTVILSQLVLGAIICVFGEQLENVDVVQGKSVRLPCRFGSRTLSKDQIFWVLMSDDNKPDLIHAAGVFFSHDSYSVDASTEEGRFDLIILQAEYAKHNSLYRCRSSLPHSGYKEIAFYSVTVLIPPGIPQITPPKPMGVEGKTFALTCMSQGGSPDPLIQWYKGQRALQGQLQKGGSPDRPTTSVLSIDPRMEDDNATYRCSVWNRAVDENRKLEASVLLRVQYAPRITVGPYNPLRVLSGNDATLACLVLANPPARSVRWLKSGQLLSHTANHTIPSVHPDDSGTYTCVAENGIGEAQINLELSVLHGPEVNLIPEKEVSLTESLAVKCNIASYPAPHTIEWFKEDDLFFRQTGDTLRLDSVSSEDAGKYTCKASVTIRPSGSSMQYESSNKSSIIIHIKHKPGETIIKPSTLEAVSGKPFTMQCTAKPLGYPLPQYKWWREGQENIMLSRDANYTISSAHVSLEGQYYCQTNNILGSGSIASAYLTVYEPVSMVLKLKPDMIQKEGDSNFAITCRARGKPMPQVQWTHNGQTIPADSGFFKIESINSIEDNNVNLLQSTLKFEGRDRKNGRLTSEDRGKFACIYDNGFKNDFSDMVLKVEHSPIVKHTYNRVAFDPRETAVLKCIMQAYPAPTFEWHHYGRLLEGNNYNNYGTNVTDIGGDTYIGTLSIRDITEDDYGEYTCRAYNAINGDKKTIIKLVKKGVPERPSNVELVDASSDKVTLRWNEGFNGGFSSTEYLITYWPIAGNTRGRNESCRTQTVCEIIGLHSETEYKFKVLAVNPRGYSPYSDELIVKTKPNLRDLPRALDAHFDKESSQLVFSVDPPPIPLLAKVQARYADSDEWILQKYIEINSPEETVYLKPGDQSFSDVRVTLCLQSNESWCGDAKIASPFDDSSPRSVETAGAVSFENVVLIIATSGIISIIILGGFICYFCCKRGNKGSKKKQEIKTLNAGPPPVTLPYYSEENLTKHGDVLDAQAKPNIYMTPNDHMCTGVPDHGLLYPGERDMGNCMGPDGHLNMLLKNGDMPPDGSYYPFEGEMVHDYYSGSDFKPVNDEMMNMKNREHLHSPYYDVSGLPDPYSMRDDEKVHHNSMCFDESLESGYSTPNSRSRRIIREIIV
ncbi:hemicentin-1-like isoform X2 [Stegodyphus dumicola]|uniref:hemicentin-1-like isoform X2 n=1 Tax=Stegodyphus dumicola TaxID=202533 RepID=UPI0015AD7E63|nr:hemicentin-1-like isoform X2 [Stegodyphus dumicola]